jgi:hypothetical protein
VVDLGTLRPGQSAQATITLRNTSEKPVIVDRIETSCECLELSHTTLTLPRWSSVSFRVDFDAASAADFSGNLRIRINGLSETGSEVFTVEVTLTVAQESGAITYTYCASELDVRVMEVLCPETLCKE